MAAVEQIVLTDEQKIEILKGAQELLGPNGENWAKCTWWGCPYDTNTWPYSEDDYAFKPGDEAKGLDVEEADEATVWCLMGALEESAYRLGITSERDASVRLARPISIQEIIRERTMFDTVIEFNDAEETDFNAVKELLNERLAQLGA